MNAQPFQCYHILRGLNTWKQSTANVAHQSVWEATRESYTWPTSLYIHKIAVHKCTQSAAFHITQTYMSALFLHYPYLFFWLAVYRASGSLQSVLKWGLECCGWRKREMESRETNETKRSRSVCPVRLLPLHNLWAVGADHHGSVPPAAPGAVWDRPVNWMPCSCWARKALFLPSSVRNRPATSPASYLWAQQGPRSAKNKMEAKKGRESGQKNGKAFCRSLPGLSIISPPSFTPSFNRQPPTPPSLHTHCANPCPYSPQCLLHYWLQCFSAPQPYAQCWGPPVTQLHTN